MTSISTINVRPHHPSINSIAKRFIDILGSLVGLLILSVLFIPIAIAIKLDSPGPIIYVQKRYGLYGQPFKFYKFRSMIHHADRLKYQVKNQANGLMFKNYADPRVTSVGHFLRRTSLDELPQFWNVLIGDMSLVGTRPPTADEIIHYSDYNWQRLWVKPGITGEWQVNGRSQITDFETVMEFDLRYQRLWSVWYDIRILVKTLYVVIFRHRQAA